MSANFDFQQWHNNFINRVAPVYIERIGDEFVFLRRDSIEAVEREYPARLKQARAVSGVDADHVKYIGLALYVQLCMEYPIFGFHAPIAGHPLPPDAPEISEQYCLRITLTVLRHWTEGQLDKYGFETDKNALLKALTHIRMNSDSYKRKLKSTTRLAAIIYGIGQKYFN